jgi:hypothetical protein
VFKNLEAEKVLPSANRSVCRRGAYLRFIPFSNLPQLLISTGPSHASSVPVLTRFLFSTAHWHILNQENTFCNYNYNHRL